MLTGKHCSQILEDVVTDNRVFEIKPDVASDEEELSETDETGPEEKRYRVKYGRRRVTISVYDHKGAHQPVYTLNRKCTESGDLDLSDLTDDITIQGLGYAREDCRVSLTVVRDVVADVGARLFVPLTDIHLRRTRCQSPL